MNLKEHFEKVREERDNLKGQVDLLHSEIENKRVDIKRFEDDYTTMEMVLDLIRIYADLKEKEIEGKIDNVITKGLRGIFPDENFKSTLRFRIKGGQAVAEPKLLTSNDENAMPIDIVSADSGGVANIVGLLYQLLTLAQKKPLQRQMVWADEPFKNLSKKYLEAAGEFLKKLVEKLEMQIVLITHKEELKEIGDMVYEFTKKDDRTKITLESDRRG